MAVEFLDASVPDFTKHGTGQFVARTSDLEWIKQSAGSLTTASLKNVTRNHSNNLQIRRPRRGLVGLVQPVGARAFHDSPFHHDCHRRRFHRSSLLVDLALSLEHRRSSVAQYDLPGDHGDGCQTGTIIAKAGWPNIRVSLGPEGSVALPLLTTSNIFTNSNPSLLFFLRALVICSCAALALDGASRSRSFRDHNYPSCCSSRSSLSSQSPSGCRR